MRSSSSPPQFFLRFFRWFCHPELKKYIEGDLLELYHERLKASGKRTADVKFVIDVLLLFRPGIIRPAEGYKNLNTYGMYKSYFKIGWRNLLRNKGYSFINIGGLALGMTIAMLIGLWVNDELSFNKTFKNYDRIARVMQNQTFNGQIETRESQPMQLGDELRNGYGNNFEHVVMSTWTWDHKLTYKDRSIMKPGNFMEPGVGEMLSLKMVSGSQMAALKDLHSVLLSQSVANALFGDVNPFGKTIRLNDKLDVTVTGVYEDLPYNSSFAELSLILPWDLHIKTEGLDKRLGWGNNWFQCVVQMADHVDVQHASYTIKDAKLQRVSAEGSDTRNNPQLFLHPMSRWRLHSNFENGVAAGGRIKVVWMFGMVGLFVLMLACINFMNLSTARSEKRAKEVGIRKCVGSVRTQLISQFFTESLLVSIVAFIFSLVMVQLALPWFNEIADKRISILWNLPSFWLAALAFVLFTGLIAGSYPALYLSSFKPITVLKGVFRAGRFAAVPRKALVVMQFTISVALVIGTMVVFRQIQYAQDRPIGYTLNGLISSPIRDKEILKHFDAFRNELLNTGAVLEVSASRSPITQTSVTNSGFNWKGKDPNMSDEFAFLGVTHSFGKTVGWQMLEGRDFSKDYPSDSSAFIINEAAAKYIGLDNPVGEIVSWKGNGEWKIIGIVKDMVIQSPYAPVKQTVFMLDYNRAAVVNMRIHPEVSAREALAKIESVFAKYDPANIFEYHFSDEDFAKKFASEKRIGDLALISTVLAIFISSLGLFGLASFVAEQRTKEIGIRKVLGATITQVWQLLSTDFVLLVVIACFIATPLSYYLMDKWLMQYPYRIGITWDVFVFASFGAFVITLLTVSYQALKAAIASPVKSLRTE